MCLYACVNTDHLDIEFEERRFVEKNRPNLLPFVISVCVCVCVRTCACIMCVCVRVPLSVLAPVRKTIACGLMNLNGELINYF